jgi:hypothetical protein
MRKHTRFSQLIVVLILLSFTGVNLSQAQQSSDYNSSTNFTQTPNSPWRIEYIQQRLNPPLSVGRFLSISRRPSTGMPYVSYYDQTYGKQMVASRRYVGGGTCGTNNIWYCHSITEGLGTGLKSYSSIDVWDYPNHNWKYGLSYAVNNNHSLKALIGYCNEQAGLV